MFRYGIKDIQINPVIMLYVPYINFVNNRIYYSDIVVSLHLIGFGTVDLYVKEINIKINYL